MSGPERLPRLLAGTGERRAIGYDDHLALHGELPLERRRRRRAEPRLVEELELAGLRGRGGGGFPTASKLRAVARARRGPVVVVNATEGEPASRKDRVLCELAPHLILDGAELVTRALDADCALVCVCESAPEGAVALSDAIEERRRLDGSCTRTALRTIPHGYLAGQESALVAHLNGGPALPTFTPPMVFEQGVGRRPTFLSNAETFAHVALIARHGARWFRELGTTEQPGSALVTLSGAVARPGVYEIAYGAELSSLVAAAGGATEPVRAALFGGYAGAWIDGSQLNRAALADEHLAAHGASLGAGVVLLLGEESCPVAEVTRIARWLAGQSARQCGPCLHGLDALAEAFGRIAEGGGEGGDLDRVRRLCSLVRRRGACSHPDGAARFALSAAEVFAEELADHARYGRCPDCDRHPHLPLGGARQDVARERVSLS